VLLCWQGDTSSQSEPGRYLQAVQALISRYHSLADAAAAAGGGGGGVSALPPLVINTPGWITGLGLELLGEVLRCAQPTHGECVCVWPLN
jgi:polynucleotide 5'-hydroxyl-kinase GRC3/NOL9